MMLPRLALLFLVTTGFSPAAPDAPPTPLQIFDAKPELADLDMQIYPLGWSADGKHFAYLAIRPWEAADAPTITQIIVDLTSDKILHEQRWDTLDENGLKFDDRQTGFAAFWKLHGTTILSSLEKHKIIRSEFKLQTFPGFFGEHRRGVLNTTITQKTGKHPLGELGGTSQGVSEYTIDLIQGTKQKNVFNSTKSKEKLVVYPLAVNVHGFLTNKSEDRIAILVAYTQIGWEGPPHTRLLKVVGASIGDKF